MPASIEHRAHIHELVAERKAAGLPVWDFSLDLSDISKNDDLTPKERGLAIAEKVRASRWMTLNAGDEGEFAELIDELSDVDDDRHFDLCMDCLYDQADIDRVWIDTTGNVRKVPTL
jgi:hypothetical protein